MKETKEWTGVLVVVLSVFSGALITEYIQRRKRIKNVKMDYSQFKNRNTQETNAINLLRRILRHIEK